MREGQFIRKNIEKWRGYQYEPAGDPDEMASQFTDLVNDLGYSKTFYPHGKVTAYLNGLATKIYLGIYQNKKEEGSRVVRFWKTELPGIIYAHRRKLFYAFLIFTGFALMAAFSAAHDETFVRGILGDGYVEMTDENISKGDPFGVYKDDDALMMFVRIAVNNIRVSLFTFVGGIFVSIGAVWFLLVNGVMVGAFQYYFFAKGLGWDSVLVIWIHGTLEISSIILSGAAGMIMGNSLLFPGTHKRIEALREGAKDGLKLLVGVVPMLVVAACLEGFVTRYSRSGMPLLLSLLILLISASWVIWYFVVYPYRMAHPKIPLSIKSVAP